MYYYRLYGFRVVSDLKFPQLVEEQEGMPEAEEIYIREGDVPDYVKAIPDNAYEFGTTFSWLVNRTTWMTVENGNSITYCRQEGANEMYLCTYLLGYGMSMLALQKGILAIHCSALCDDEGAVLIAGESGAGKSTVTAAFLEQGYRLMADDMAFVETVQGVTLVKPAFPFQKLCRNVVEEKGYESDRLIYIDEDKDKFLVRYEGDFSIEAVPVKAFMMLGVTGGEEVTTLEIAGLERFRMYANNLFLRHFLGKDKYQPAIGQKCLEMAANVPTYYIGRPRGKDTAEQVVAEAFRLISNSSVTIVD